MAGGYRGCYAHTRIDQHVIRIRIQICAWMIQMIIAMDRVA